MVKRNNELFALAVAGITCAALSGALFSRTTVATPAATAVQSAACPAGPPGQGPNFRWRQLINPNFSYLDLTNADFTGATLDGAVFIGTNLTGANFSNAVFTNKLNPGQAPNLPTDFSTANLTSACFIGATFEATDAPVYFTYANLTCADFSNTDISRLNAIFGPSPLDFDRTGAACKPTFRATTMNCEFIDDWIYMDLDYQNTNQRTNISACAGQLAGRDFSNARMAGVDLTGVNLDGAKFIKADLTQAIFNGASLRNADFTSATLFGAQFNNANLQGASLYAAFLSNNTGGSITTSASLQNAHLKNVNLSFAQLSGVNLSFANFYGDSAAGTGSCATAGGNYQGFTQGCASAHGANLTDATFDNAYLYGVDFTNASVAGTSFLQAVLAGSNFASATLSGFSQSGKGTTFRRAHMQGVNLATAVFSSAAAGSYDLTDAFVDFTAGGNNIYILLNGTNHNSFACSPAAPCSPPTGQDVCVEVNYPGPTTIPGQTSGFTCPNATTTGCGPATPDGSNVRWASRLVIGSPPPGVPPAWYDQDATYTKAPANPGVVCGGKGIKSAITFW